MKRWEPAAELTKKEQFIIKRLKRTRKLFAFLRLHRHELFDDGFQEELEGMYRGTGAGDEPVPPAQLCMALVLQGYHRISDAEAVELTMMDLRWQMVLGCVGADEPAFAQGTLQAFRERLIAADMDRRLLERTIELARQTKEFDWKKLPKDLRLAIDSRPFEGAGRVEDTFNLLGHAARKIVACAVQLTGWSREQICLKAGIPLLLSSSIKAGLDINWSDPEQKDEAIETLSAQLTSLNDWLDEHNLATEEPLKPYLEALSQVRKQDLEVSKGRVQLRRGVAEDRRVSIEDPDMRHGRKSKSKRFNGYKQHLAADLESGLILACAVTPANRPEEEATPALHADLMARNVRIESLSIDRAYVNSQLVRDVIASRGTVLAKPWSGRNSRAPELFGKRDFKIDMRAKTITCPAGQMEPFEPGAVVEFDPEICGPCMLRSLYTLSASGGRSVHIGEDEALQQKLRKLQATRPGRERLRARTGIEHHLAHVAARQGPKARYCGTRKNVFDLRRIATIENLETTRRTMERDSKVAA
jgi:hypothetical protein